MSLRIVFLISLAFLVASCGRSPNSQVAVNPAATATCTPTSTAAKIPTPSLAPVQTATPPQGAQPMPQASPSADQAVSVDTNVVTLEPQPIFTDSLESIWQDWSWDTDHNLSNGKPVLSGLQSIAITYKKGWAGLYLHADTPLEVGDYNEICFYINGGTRGGQQIFLVINNDNSNPFTVTAIANKWTLITVPLSSLGSPTTIRDIVWQDATGGQQDTLYIDQVTLASSGAVPTITPLPGGLELSVDANANLRPISPYIYGMNFADESLAKELSLPINRWGGNATTRYNWKTDVSNRTADWFFENIPNENSNPGALPNGSSSDMFVTNNQQRGSETLLTIPMIGWTPKDRNVSCGFAVSKYGAQQNTDPYRPDCGNGIRTDGTPVTGNDPADTSIPITPTFVQEWIQHLTSTFGAADKGGVRFYNLDNEPYLWNINHRDVHPNPVTYDELRDLTYQYGAAVKAADPAAQTLGPVEWGWSGYFSSAKDAGNGKGLNEPVDRLLHGNTPLVEWYLQQMNEYEKKNGVRILDYLDLHYYPQEAGVALSSKADSTTQAMRMNSTRALWDRTYKSESWINETVYLIPRMREWVDKNYPGTKLAITEYNWGALDSINGALAQASILGIFGREGLDLAALWAPPGPKDPGAYAFRMYRNYDGKGSQFGDTSVLASSNHQETVSIFGAKRSSDSALTLMIINQSNAKQNATVNVANFNSAAQAHVYQYSKENLAAIVQLPDNAVSGGKVSLSIPAGSITLLVLPAQ